MLDSLIEAYVQYVIELIELQKLLSQDLRCLCGETTAVPSEWTVPKSVDVGLLHFYCIRNNRCICTLYIQYIYTLRVRMSISGVVMHYVVWGCQSPNPQAIHCFKWEFCVQFARRFSGTYPWRTAGPACICFIMCRVFLILFRQHGQLCPIESLHLPWYAVTAVVPRATLKETLL
jgi:hypothetical protein